MTDDEIAKVADAAATKAVDMALDRMYTEIGKGVLKKAAWIVGVAIVAFWIYLSNHGLPK